MLTNDAYRIYHYVNDGYSEKGKYMKKRLIVILSALLLIVIASAVFAGIKFGVETAVYVKAGNGASLFISEKTGEPVVMNGNFRTVGNTKTGDKIIAVHDKRIMETYPAQTNVYFCIKIKSDYKSVNSETYPSLAQLGWLETESGSSANEISFRYCRIRIPGGWKAEDMMMTGKYYCDSDIKKISPKQGYENGYMTLAHYPQNNFTPSRKGLSEEEMILSNGMKAKAGYYDGSQDWKYVAVTESDGYVYENFGLNHEDSLAALEIIKSTTFA